MLKTTIAALLCLYLVALHCSIAAMGLISSLIFLAGLIEVIANRSSIRTPLDAPIFLFLAVILLNLALTPAQLNLVDRLEELIWIFTFWGLTKALEAVWDDALERKLLRLWFALLAVSSVYGVAQFFTGIDIIRGHPDHLAPVGGFSRSTGFYSSALTYAYCMGMSGLILMLPSSKLKKWMPTATFLMASLAVIVTQARGAWLAWAIVTASLLVILRRRLTKVHLTVVALMALLPIIVLSTAGGQKRMLQLIGGQLDQSSAIRLDLWKAYFQMFLDRPVLGVGYQQGRELLQEYYRKLGIHQDFVSHAHNDYVQALGETGVLGFSAFIFLIGFTMWRTYRLRTYRPEWSLSLLAGQVFVFLGSLTQANFTDAEVSHFLMFNWAIMSVLHTRASKKLGHP